MKRLTSLLLKILGENNFKILYVFISRIINNQHIKEWVCVQSKYYKIIKSKKKNVFFGYYDYNSVNNEKVLFIKTEQKRKNYAEIYYFDLKKEEEKFITTTNSCSLQMGCRLKWISDNEIIFNDYNINEGYISKVYDVYGKEIKKYKFPIYDISNNKEYSFYLNFDLLQKFRPGYGYTNNEKKISIVNENGIYRGNFTQNSNKLILPIDKIKNYNFKDIEKTKNHYVNHISCSPFGKKILFFHLWTDENNELRNRVFIIDYEGNVIKIISDFKRASHYTWKNENEILLTVLKNDKIKYILYNIEKDESRILEFLEVDGHPTYIDEFNFITDTYPDQNGMQHIFLCNEKSILYDLVQIYHNPRKNGEYRCDLHPRYFNKILTFDSNKEKYRCENIIKLDIEKIIKDKKIEKEIEIKDDKQIYMFLYKKIAVNSLKMLIAKLYDFKYKAHILVRKMLKEKKKIKKNIYFNKLQSKYSMWISPNCKIGKNINFMHLDGITIGSGVIIGNNCTIYQQVTLGKEKGKFPIIGDNVIIYAGAKIIGNVKIGNNAIIGTNAVVLNDVPDNCIAVGIPARIIRKD